MRREHQIRIEDTRLLRSITDKRDDAEVKEASDGTLKVYEVRKTDWILQFQ